MKKIYLFVTIALSLFTFDASAIIKIKSYEAKLKEETSNFQINLNSELIKKTSVALADPTINPTVSSTSICEGDNLILTANPSGGVAPYTFFWTGPNGFVSSVENPVINNISIANSGIYSLYITDALNITSTTQSTAAVIVNTKIDPVFDATLPAICKGGFAAILSTTSTNGITGTWNPATVNNTNTTTYLFTPDSGQCANSLSFTIFVVNNVEPKFTLPPSICTGNTPPELPAVSNNGIVGTWNPTVVSNTVSGTYTFTPTAGQCALPTTLGITITPKTIPLFDPIADVCYGSIAPSLPITSTNGITGTWNPATVSNLASGTYTFTPNPGPCETTTTININVNTIVPTFNTITSICVNSIAPTLSATSTNGITGIWNPATVSNIASGTYTFTPDAGQCAISKTLNITVNPILTPSFTAIAPICSGATSPILPLISNNGIVGTWNPTVVSNTSSGIYNFTPAVGECAIATTLNVTVIQNVTPTFTTIDPICSGSTRPVLPTTSTNSIPGTWNPSTVSNTASGTYTFTPTLGQCAFVTTMSIVVYQSPTDIILTTTDVVNEAPDGIIEITGVTSGVAPFQYSINNSSFTADTTYSGLIAGNYTITVRDSNGCEFKKTIKINSLCLFPNSISPNNDTRNDTFNLKGCDVAKLELYNRHGVEVNRYNNYSDQWDGTNNNGESLPDGTYFYIAEKKDGTSKSGWVFIAR